MLRAIGTVALVALMALGICASAAGADPLSMTFTESRANVGVQLSDDPLFEAPDTAPFAAQIDPGSGSIAGGHLQVPQFSTHITSPVNADVAVDFDIGVITGGFNQATGALTLEGIAGGTLTSEGKECTVSTTPSPLVLTTAGNSGGANPRPGAPFTAGLSGSGAIAGQWTNMEATPVSPGDTATCEVVEENIEGPGGVWLKQNGKTAPPPPPPPPTCTVPKLVGKKLKAAKRRIRAAGCKVGEVTKPKPRKGKRLGQLLVKSSTPAAGEILPLGSKVDLRVGLKHRKARHY